MTKNTNFKLVPAGKGDEDPFRGDQNLLDKHGLAKIAQLVLAGSSKVENYIGDTNYRFYKGANMTLEPLADIFPSSSKPKFRKLPDSIDVSLEPGRYSLPDLDLGTPVNSKELAGGLLPAAVGTVEKKLTTKIKLKVVPAKS